MSLRQKLTTQYEAAGDPLVRPEKALGDLLALMRAQYLSYQTSHWQVLGDGFYGNHQLFQRLYEGVQGEVDVLAEKMVGYFGRDVVNVMTSTARILPWVDKWSHIDCHHKRGLQSELDFQMLTKLIHEALQGRMSLGLDDWLMSTASAHETHTYLLQQVLATPHGKTAGAARPLRPGTMHMVKKPFAFHALHGNSFRAKPGEILRIERTERMGRGDPGHPEDPIIVFRMVSPRVDKPDFSNDYFFHKGWGPLVYHLGREVSADEVQGDSVRNMLATSYEADNPGDSGAGSEEGRFFDNPEKREVREFAQTDAITNAPDVAAEAASEDNLDISKAKAVSEAKKAPPTPDEIVKKPGGEAVSTLNRYIVETGEDVPKSVPQSHEEVPKHPVITADWSHWNTVR